MREELTQKLRSMPHSPGVYIFKDSRNKVLYVGKAIDLHERVMSYIRGGDERVFSQHLVERIADVEFVLTENEKEALILENNLIKQFKPRFNINLKDDKTFLSLRINAKDKFPRIEIVRRYKDDGALYFGPYSSASAVRHTVRLLNSVFPLRKCRDSVFKKRSFPCLYAQIGKCLGPCSGEVNEEYYKRVVEQVILFLRGKTGELLDTLRQEMNSASSALEFEKAGRIRDRILAIEKTVQHQRITTPAGGDRDIFGLFKEDERLTVFVMFVRDGRLDDFKPYFVSTHGMELHQAFTSFLQQFYSLHRLIPDEILLPIEVEGKKLLEEWLAERRGMKVTLLVPKRGEKAGLVELATRNAEEAYRLKSASSSDATFVLRKLMQGLKLSHLPEKIECFDISNLGSASAVGSMVRFENAKPNKTLYRRFKIRGRTTQNDFAMMAEVVRRRLQRSIQEKDLPDLIVIDGGKGQLSVVLQVIRELGLENLDIVSLAKSRTTPPTTRQPRRKEPERVFVPGLPEPVVLPEDSAELHLLNRIRDEAHRFAFAYHRKLLGTRYRRSLLEEIPGIGPKRRKALIKHFGSIDALKKASIEEIASVEGIPVPLAEKIHRFFHNASPSEP